MSTEDPPLNPYAPTLEVSADEARPVLQDEIPNTLRRAAARWFTVCGISAAPSFLFGLAVTGGQVAGMVLGILLFAIGYTLIDYRTAERPIRRKRTVRRTLRITYGTRIAISLIFPVGMYLDMICGVFSLQIVSGLAGDAMGPNPMNGPGASMGFVASLATTLVQGCLLNIVLAVYALLVHGIQALVIALKR